MVVALVVVIETVVVVTFVVVVLFVVVLAVMVAVVLVDVVLLVVLEVAVVVVELVVVLPFVLLVVVYAQGVQSTWPGAMCSAPIPHNRGLLGKAGEQYQGHLFAPETRSSSSGDPKFVTPPSQ